MSVHGNAQSRDFNYRRCIHFYPNYLSPSNAVYNGMNPFTYPHHTSHAKDLLPSGRNRPLKDVEIVVDWVEMCQQQLKTTRLQIFASVVLFPVGVLLPDCWRCCGLGLCGPRQQTLSHPGRGPRWTCGCCWHEGKFEKQKRPRAACVDEEVVYDIKRRCALNVCSPSFELL